MSGRGTFPCYATTDYAGSTAVNSERRRASQSIADNAVTALAAAETGAAEAIEAANNST